MGISEIVNYQCIDCKRGFNQLTKPTLSSAWRRKFIKQMQLLNFTKLVQWLTWQRSRRYNQVSQEVLLTKKI